MIVHSQKSISSQISNSNEANSNAEFVSQLPFVTQQPYKVPLLKERGKPSIEDDPEELLALPEVSDLLAELKKPPPSSQYRRTGEKGPSKDSPSNRFQPHSKEISTSQTSSKAPEPAPGNENLLNDKISLPSTSDFLDCQPLRTPQELAPTATVCQPVNDGPLHTQRPIDDTPVTLSEQIRAVRADAGRTGLRFSAKWARLIPKSQKAILETDDAWSPPLPGRTQRQGTIPIGVLNLLTIQADREAEEKDRRKKTSQEAAAEVEDETKLGTLATTSSNSLAHSREGSPEVHSDTSSETREASLWSTSPPEIGRRNLPPDSSPPQPVEGEIIQSSPGVPEQDSKSTSSEPQHVPLSHDEIESLVRPQIDPPAPSQMAQVDSHVNSSLESIPEATSGVRVMQNEPKDIVKGKRRSSQEDGEPLILSKDTTKTSTKIHVKQTPHPVKSDQATRKQTILTNGMPSSSIVPGTFPSEPSRIMKRPRVPEDNHKSQSNDCFDPDYEEFDNERKRQRRAFQQEHKKANATIDDGRTVRGNHREGFLPDDNNTGTALSNIDGLRTTGRKRSSAYVSATNTPRQSPMLIGKGGGASEQSTESKSGSVLTILFVKFKLFYPSYPGSSDIFRSTFNRLFNLWTHKMEPPSLMWDDFIYRFASDYENYVRVRIQNGVHEPASYQTYVHEEVQQLKCVKRCITIETLRDFQYATISTPKGRSPSRSNSRMDTDQFEIISISPDPDEIGAKFRLPTSIRPTDSTIAPSIQETPSQRRQPISQASRAPAVIPLDEQPISGQRANPTEFLKPSVRRGLPWISKTRQKSPIANKSLEQKADLTPQNIQNMRATSETSSKVEKWLVRPSGAESPVLGIEDPPQRVREILPELVLDKSANYSHPRPSQVNRKGSNTSAQPSRNENAEMSPPNQFKAPDSTIMTSIERDDTASTRVSAHCIWKSQSEESIRQRIRRSELPATLLGTFQKNYRDLQEEQRHEKQRRKSTHGGINLHNWEM